MAKNTGSSEEKLTTPSQNGQGHSDVNSLIPTEISVVPCNQYVEEPMQELNKQKKKKKKKSRGDRKAQHKRRRLRRQQRKLNENQNPIEPNVVCLRDDPNEQQIQAGASFFR
jgi:hypothetical protein